MKPKRRCYLSLLIIVLLSPYSIAQEAHNKTLSPVYAPLAEWLAERHGLGELEGIAIDIGSGPGDLIIEFCHRTRLHWINADIDAEAFGEFFDMAKAEGAVGQVSAICADACELPFRDNYADFICSRGSFHFWKERLKAFAEIYRVLKPGAHAYIGRGFSENLSPETARSIREKQSKGEHKLNYSIEDTERHLRDVMKTLGIESYKIIKPQPPGSEGILYGIWIEIYKPQS